MGASGDETLKLDGYSAMGVTLALIPLQGHLDENQDEILYMNRHEYLTHYSCVYLEKAECETCCLNIIECGNKSFRFDASGASRLRLIWCYLFYNIEKDIHSSIFYKEEILHHNMHFILHVLDDQMGSERMGPCFFAM